MFEALIFARAQPNNNGISSGKSQCSSISLLGERFPFAACHRSFTARCCRRVPFVLYILIVFCIILIPSPQQLTCQEGPKDRTPSLPEKESSALVSGVLFAGAALCTVNLCVNGTCYENGGLQICVCDMPYSGPLCTDVISMCTDGCGIKPSTGIDCSSALCSLGTCQDTNTEPYYKCDCGDFFTGNNCETHNNPCTNPAANPCGEGTCTFSPGKGSGTVTCTCDSDYETAFGAGVMTVKWGNSEVLQSPPCTVRKTRGVAKMHFTISAGALVMWWTIFAVVLLLLIWCCYTVFAENCGRWSTAFKAARAAKNL
ncbi:hypothetical protein, conserved [Eimeria necatrix]|uniref:EGF-like domain-containing protein n=1 Tax=Eimeria necatrix TaxID=51315 RepID=U6MYL3_9EIME|nr:hypothetical protein, conserved [Eimeria necatrix]CDJ67574.1 hypothetical protein, conserved [Eimeria necatrix]